MNDAPLSDISVVTLTTNTKYLLTVPFPAHFLLHSLSRKDVVSAFNWQQMLPQIKHPCLSLFQHTTGILNYHFAICIR